MTFGEYQQQSRKTAIYPASMALSYPALGLAGECGEVANKVKKVFRDHGGNLAASGYAGAIEDEIGDVIWYVAQLATDAGLSLDCIAERNLAKLAKRQAEGKLGGDGDNR